VVVVVTKWFHKPIKFDSFTKNEKKGNDSTQKTNESSGGKEVPGLPEGTEIAHTLASNLQTMICAINFED